VIAALNGYLGWLKTDLLARSNGDFRIGAETFSKKLEYDEMVDLPLDKLLEIGWADLRKNQAHFKQVAKELEPAKSRARCLRSWARIIPRPIICWTPFAPPSMDWSALSARITS
jgi:hypothetical protein